MNFIDKALAKKNRILPDDFLQEMAGIYEETEVWEILNQYPQFVQDVIYIIDYDTELQMEGLEGFVQSSIYFQQTISALENCQLCEEADLVRKAKSLDQEVNDEVYDAKMELLESKIALHQNQEEFWNKVRAYVKSNLKRI